MPNVLILTAVEPGEAGNRIAANLVGVTDASTVAVAVTNTNYNQHLITITVGYDAGTLLLNVGNWAAVAALVNASAAAALVTVVGDAGQTNFDAVAGLKQLTMGTANNGLTMFFFQLDATNTPQSYFFVVPLPDTRQDCDDCCYDVLLQTTKWVYPQK